MEKRRSEIRIGVELDENSIPENIRWKASEKDELKEAKALMLQVWDAKEMNTLRVDLWTKDMPVDHMKRFMYQSLITMSDTLERSTNESNMAGAMREFARMFGEKLKVIQAQ